MKYLGNEHLELLFETIYTHYARREEVPHYQDEQSGIEKLKGVFQGVRMDEFYPDFFDKAAYLFIQINEGHFFSNGNKRLALVVTAVFVRINEFLFQKKNIRSVFQNYFQNITIGRILMDFIRKNSDCIIFLSSLRIIKNIRNLLMN